MLQNQLNQCTVAKNVLYSYCDDIKENSLIRKFTPAFYDVITYIQECFIPPSLRIVLLLAFGEKNFVGMKLSLFFVKAKDLCMGIPFLILFTKLLSEDFCCQSIMENNFKMKCCVNNEMFSQINKKDIFVQTPEPVLHVYPGLSFVHA